MTPLGPHHLWPSYHHMYESRGGFTVSNGHPLTQAEGHTQKPRHFPPLPFWSFPIHPLSIIDNWISPLRCTKNHFNISLFELKHQYFTGWLFVERMKGWKCAMLLLFPCAPCCRNEKQFSCPRDFFHLYLTRILRSVWCILCSLSAPFFRFLFNFPTSIYNFPGGENLVEQWGTTGPDLFIMLLCVCGCSKNCWCVFTPHVLTTYSSSKI